MPLVNKLCIVGLGLIGGSIGLAVRKKRLARRVYGLVRRKESIKEAKRLGVVDVATMDGAEAVSEADLIIIATPLGVVERIAITIRPFLSEGCIITDVGSSKRCIVSSMEKICHPRARFVGAHPIAGSEQSGMRAARDDLFAGTPCILTPTRETDRAALKKVRELWESLGSSVRLTSPNDHDKIVAAISHLPHILAATLVNYLTRMPGGAQKFLPFAGTGFKDATRIASSPSDIWVDICLANRDEILRALKVHQAELASMEKALKKGDAARLKDILLRANRLRKKIGAC
ncbi:MAG: prephenate dehydrogenase/arogenate dehydrogenase family protein [Candidatus Aureabacteria bacterium]|nr:prephenate dehydrogenase/arogenate dehydrogenase family protein [Candidatus Auribacterota bacterium]